MGRARCSITHHRLVCARAFWKAAPGEPEADVCRSFATVRLLPGRCPKRPRLCRREESQNGPPSVVVAGCISPPVAANLDPQRGLCPLYSSYRTDRSGPNCPTAMSLCACEIGCDLQERAVPSANPETHNTRGAPARETRRPAESSAKCSRRFENAVSVIEASFDIRLEFSALVRRKLAERIPREQILQPALNGEGKRRCEWERS